MEADALATAILVLGPREGYDWAERRRIAAVLTQRDGDGLRRQATTAWNADEQANLSQESDQTMVTYFILTAIVFGVVIAAMAIGVILSNRRIQGTCGGLAGMRDSSGNTACELCSNPSPSCSGNPEERETAGQN